MSFRARLQKSREALNPKAVVCSKRRRTAEDEEDVRAALEVLNDPNEVFVPYEEVQRKHGLSCPPNESERRSKLEASSKSRPSGLWRRSRHSDAE